jgi:hypothetical protein
MWVVLVKLYRFYGVAKSLHRIVMRKTALTKLELTLFRKAHRTFVDKWSPPSPKTIHFPAHQQNNFSARAP